MSLLIKGGRVLDPATQKDEVADIYIEDGKIAKIGKNLKVDADETIDAKKKLVMPGFIDLHVHLRDPGFTKKETVRSGAAAAARGGYTTIMAMPNTKPVVDNADVLSYVLNKGKNVAKIQVLQAGSMTKKMAGKEVADIEAMAEAGALAFSEDGKSVMNSKVCRDAMRLTAKLGVPFLDHCEDIDLVDGGVMNDDENAVRLGLPGIPNVVENSITVRDMMIAQSTGAQLHLCHVSTKEVITLLRVAKEDGINISAEVCPHHFTLTSDDIVDGPGITNYKMNPPLRTKADVDAIKEGLADGTIDAIATDHAPHTEAEKNNPMQKAPFGIVGSETAAALTYTELVKTGILTPLQMAEKMSYAPAQILHIDKGELAVGKDADIVIFDPNKNYTIDKEKFVSKGRNTPFHGRKVTGQVCQTIAAGEIVYNMEDEKND